MDSRRPTQDCASSLSFAAARFARRLANDRGTAHGMRWAVFGSVFLALACACSGDDGGAEGGGGPGGSFEGCGDVASNCVVSTSCSTVACPFDSSEVDCEVACANVLELCDGGCAAATCDRFIDLEFCVQVCGLENDFSCGNATFGCYTQNDTCESIAGCLGCSP